MIGITSLNDDCLREVFNYCGIKDQIVLVQVCARFRKIIQDMWKGHWNDLSLQSIAFGIRIHHPNDVMVYINFETFATILDLLHSFVKTMLVTGKKTEMWEVINRFQFTATTELHLNNIGESSIANTCFQNIRSLIVSGNSMLSYNPQWSKLENLDLSSSRMSIDKIMEFVSHVKLKTLKFRDFNRPIPMPIPARYTTFDYLSEIEELSFIEFGTNELLNALNGMKNLRKLTLQFYDWTPSDGFRLTSMLSKLLEERVVELCACFWLPEHFSESLTSIKNQVRQFRRLRTLTLTNCDLDDLIMFSDDFPMLKAVVFKYKPVDAENLMNILITAKQVEFLEFRHCSMKSGSGPLCLDVAEIEKNRMKPITINVLSREDIWGSPEQENLQISLSTPSNLIKITTTHTENLCYQYQYILDT